MTKAASKTPWIETPLIWSRNLSEICKCNIYLKLENTQPSGSFKSRGIGNFMASHLPENPTSLEGHDKPSEDAHQASQATQFYCSSAGNAGLGCVAAAVTFGCRSTIVVPCSTSEHIISKLEKTGATRVIQTGASWYEADVYLKEVVLPEARSQGCNAVYVPPFDAPEIWAGNSTIVDEIVCQLPTMSRHYSSLLETHGHTDQSNELELPDIVVCSVGGGGLLNGIMQGLDRYAGLQNTTARVLAVETLGADSLFQSVQKGELVTLPEITSIATTLGARTVSKQAFKYAMEKTRVTCAVLTDAEAVHACKQFVDDERILVEPACAVALAALYTGKLREMFPNLRRESRVVVVVCGGSGLTLEILGGYIKMFLE